MRIGAGGHGQGVGLHQFIAVGAVHLLLHQPQQQGGQQCHAEIADHFDDGGGEVHQVDADDVAVGGKELHKADDEHDGGVLDVDDEVVADLGNDVANGLGQNDAGHGLHMGHADGLGSLGLAGINGDDAAADGFGHVGAGVDGDNKQGAQPDAAVAGKGSAAGEIGNAIVEEHGLKHHGGAAEHLHIDAHQHADELQKETLDDIVLLGIGNGVQNAAQQADETADQRGGDGQHQRVADAGQVFREIGDPQFRDVAAQRNQTIHRGLLSLKLASSGPEDARAG